MVFLLLLIASTLLVLTVRLAAQTERQFAEPELAAVPVPPRAVGQRLACRILFVARRVLTDEVVIDGVVVDSDRFPAGTPFSLTVAELGTGWFADIAESMLRRWADEDTVVWLDVADERTRSRVDARDDCSRVRLDVRRRVGLS